MIRKVAFMRHISTKASLIPTKVVCRISGTTKAGEYDAVLPGVGRTAWINSLKQITLDSTDLYPEGYRVGDQWHVTEDS